MCGISHPWWFSGYQTAVVAPAPGLGHTTATFLQGQGNLSCCQGGFSSGTAHQNLALTAGSILGWQVALSLRGQQGFREGIRPLSLSPLHRTRVILASLSQTGECPGSQTQACVSHLWRGGSWDYSVRELSRLPCSSTGNLCKTNWLPLWLWVDRNPQHELSTVFQQGSGLQEIPGTGTTLKWTIFISESLAHVSLGSSPIPKSFLIGNFSNSLSIAANQGKVRHCLCSAPTHATCGSRSQLEVGALWIPSAQWTCQYTFIPQDLGLWSN